MNKLVVAAGIAASLAFGAPALAQTKPTIPIIVKDTTSPYWQTVLAGARKAGQDLGVNVPELGPKSESDIDGQISILKNAVASNPAAIIIAPAQFAALGKPIDEAAHKVKIIGIVSPADSKAFTSFLTTDNEQSGRFAADALAEAIKRTYADAEGDVALITSLPGSPALMTQGAAQVLAENGTNKTGDKINLVGFGSNDELVKFLQNGTIAALVVQDPFRMGYDGVKTALAASRGEQVPANVDTGANLITKANISSARSQELLNPKIK